MKDVTNETGSCVMYDIHDIVKSSRSRYGIYTELIGCESVGTDMVSFIESNDCINKNLYTGDINDIVGMVDESGGVLIVLGCQATEELITKSVETAKKLMEERPRAHVFMGGCLAYRFDIELPYGVYRLAATRKEGEALGKQSMHKINVNSSRANKKSLLARGVIKVGAKSECGHAGLRGAEYEVDAFTQVNQLIEEKKISSDYSVMLVGDSVSSEQLEDWLVLARRYNTPLRINRMTSENIISNEGLLFTMVCEGLLPELYCSAKKSDVSNEELQGFLDRMSEENTKIHVDYFR